MLVGWWWCVKWKGYIDKARPDNSRGFTALGLLYEMLRESQSRRRKSCNFLTKSGRGANARLRSARRHASQPQRQQLLPGRHHCSPAVAVTIDSIRHTTSSAFSASRRLVKRNSRLFYLSKDTPHTHIRHVYRSLVSSRRRRPREPKWKARWTIMVKEALESDWAPPLGRGHLV